MSVELDNEEVKNLRVKLLKLHDLLQQKYGTQLRNGKTSPLDELIRTVLSQNTTEAHSNEDFDYLRRRFKTWENLMNASADDVFHVARKGTENTAKLDRLRKIFKKIHRDRGELSLDFLNRIDTKEAMKYLLSFKGVSSLTACSVLLFSLKKPVMPVNSHVERVSKRVGLVWKHAGEEDVQNVLSKVTPKYMVMSLYSQLVKLGRMICKAKSPRCPVCSINRECVTHRQKVVRKSLESAKSA